MLVAPSATMPFAEDAASRQVATKLVPSTVAVNVPVAVPPAQLATAMPLGEVDEQDDTAIESARIRRAIRVMLFSSGESPVYIRSTRRLDATVTWRFRFSIPVRPRSGQRLPPAIAW